MEDLSSYEDPSFTTLTRARAARSRCSVLRGVPPASYLYRRMIPMFTRVGHQIKVSLANATFERHYERPVGPKNSCSSGKIMVMGSSRSCASTTNTKSTLKVTVGTTRKSLALQFHLEVRPEWVQMLAKRDARELVPARFVQSAEEILGKPDGLYRENYALMNWLLRRWLEHVHGLD